MRKEIQVGDLVVVVKPTYCCGYARSLGMTFVVNKIMEGPSRCGNCGAIDETLDALKPDGDWAELGRLKRIPPLKELEGQRTEEERREPACT